MVIRAFDPRGNMSNEQGRIDMSQLENLESKRLEDLEHRLGKFSASIDIMFRRQKDELISEFKVLMQEHMESITRIFRNAENVSFRQGSEVIVETPKSKVRYVSSNVLQTPVMTEVDVLLACENDIESCDDSRIVVRQNVLTCYSGAGHQHGTVTLDERGKVIGHHEISKKSDVAKEEGTVGIAMSGVTTLCVNVVKDRLAQKRYETLAFHATRVVGMAMNFEEKKAEPLVYELEEEVKKALKNLLEFTNKERSIEAKLQLKCLIRQPEQPLPPPEPPPPLFS